jgi:xylose isomerase
MTAAGWPTLAVATLSPGQKIAGLLADRSGHDDIDSATAGRREVNIERLDQLAVEHIFGVR